MMCNAPPVALLSGPKASAEALTALSKVIATFPAISNPFLNPVDDIGIAIGSCLVWSGGKVGSLWWRVSFGFGSYKGRKADTM